jgi:hypothetical protein
MVFDVFSEVREEAHHAYGIVVETGFVYCLGVDIGVAAGRRVDDGIRGDVAERCEEVVEGCEGGDERFVVVGLCGHCD